MNVFKSDKLISRLETMIDRAIAGDPVETVFDETQLSALETKLSRYLAMTQTSRSRLEIEKKHIHQLITDISHQVKTPIANILLYTQLLEEQSLPEESLLCLTALSAQAEKLSFLTGALIKLSRMESGMLSLHPKLSETAPLLQAVTAQVKPAALEKNIELTVAPSDAAAYFDLKWTVEALANIADNAIKYTPPGGAVRLSQTPYQMFCRIDISDTGIGISESEQPKIFGRFYRSPSVSDSEGVGIGLYLAREIIREEGGYIKVSSKAGAGATFSVYLPMEN